MDQATGDLMRGARPGTQEFPDAQPLEIARLLGWTLVHKGAEAQAGRACNDASEPTKGGYINADQLARFDGSGNTHCGSVCAIRARKLSNPLELLVDGSPARGATFSPL